MTGVCVLLRGKPKNPRAKAARGAPGEKSPVGSWQSQKRQENPRQNPRPTLRKRGWGTRRGRVKARGLDLEDVAFAGDHLIEDGADDAAEKKARDEPRDDDDSEGLLRVRADASREGSGKKTKAGDKRGHHDGTQPHQRAFVCGAGHILAFKAQLIDVGDVDNGGFRRDAHQNDQSENR